MKDSEDRPQRQRFLEAAREAGCEENFDLFDDALRKVAGAKPAAGDVAKRPKKVRSTKES